MILQPGYPLAMPIDTDKIKRLRIKLGLDQQQAALATGLKSRQAWSRIETGGQPNMGIQMLERVAKTLGVKAKDLLK